MEKGKLTQARSWDVVHSADRQWLNVDSSTLRGEPAKHAFSACDLLAVCSSDILSYQGKSSSMKPHRYISTNCLLGVRRLFVASHGAFRTSVTPKTWSWPQLHQAISTGSLIMGSLSS